MLTSVVFNENASTLLHILSVKAGFTNYAAIERLKLKS